MRLRLASGIVGALLLSAFCTFGFRANAVEQGGAISGTIRYDGAPPKPVQLDVSKDRDVCGVRPLYDQSLLVGADGGIANAVVTIPDVAGGATLKPENNVRFDQKDCEYSPHVAVFPAGSTVEVINSDGILHNIHTESVANPVLDMAQPGFKKTIRVTIAKPEAIKVTCDAHNWMEGWWYATSNPYYAITDTHGRYTLNNVPPGTYELQLWQEALGVKTRQVTVKPGASTVADFTLGPVHK
jgi:plastocyanin